MVLLALRGHQELKVTPETLDQQARQVRPVAMDHRVHKASAARVSTSSEPSPISQTCPLTPSQATPTSSSQPGTSRSTPQALAGRRSGTSPDRQARTAFRVPKAFLGRLDHTVLGETLGQEDTRDRPALRVRRAIPETLVLLAQGTTVLLGRTAPLVLPDLRERGARQADKVSADQQVRLGTLVRKVFVVPRVRVVKEFMF